MRKEKGFQWAVIVTLTIVFLAIAWAASSRGEGDKVSGAKEGKGTHLSYGTGPSPNQGTTGRPEFLTPPIEKVARDLAEGAWFTEGIDQQFRSLAAEIWYFNKPIYQITSWPTKTQGFLLTPELDETRQRRLYYHVFNRSLHQYWKDYLRFASPEARGSLYALSAAQAALLGCGQGPLRHVREFSDNHLIPLLLQPEDTQLMQDFFEKFAMPVSPEMVVSWGVFCKRLYPDHPPGREEAMNVARLAAWRATDLRRPTAPWVDLVSEEMKRAWEALFNPSPNSTYEAFPDRYTLEDLLGNGEYERGVQVWTRSWIFGQGMMIDGLYFRKLREFRNRIGWQTIPTDPLSD